MKLVFIIAAGAMAILLYVGMFGRLGTIVTHDSTPLPLTQQGPDTTWARSKQFWPPGNVANPEGGQDRRHPASAASERQLPPTPERVMTLPERIVWMSSSEGVPPHLALYVATIESGINPGARHRDRHGSSYGVFQLYSGVWPGAATMTNDLNMGIGIGYLKMMLDRCRGNWSCAVRRYQGLR